MEDGVVALGVTGVDGRRKSAGERAGSLEARAISLGRRCRLCLGPNVRALRSNSDYFRTCSARCSRLWALTRYHLDDGYRARHLRAIARWTLSHEDHVSGTQLRLAASTLTGERKTNGRWTVEGSATAKALAEANALREQMTSRYPFPG